MNMHAPLLERPPRKQQLRSIQTQDKLLDAALDAFSENGFKGTSTRDIASRAGVHHPLITYHFKNKETLWRAAMNRVFLKFGAALVQSIKDAEGQSPRQRMASMIRAYVHYAAANPALHKLMLQESGRASKRLDWLIEKHLQPLSDAIVEEIIPLQERGIAPPGNPALLYNLIRVTSGGILALALEIKGTSGIDLGEKKNIDQLANMIIEIFLPGSD